MSIDDTEAEMVARLWPDEPQHVWVVTGDHPRVAGLRVSVHATQAGADKAAAELVEIIRTDIGARLPPATPENWRTVMREIELHYACSVEAKRHGVRS